MLSFQVLEHVRDVGQYLTEALQIIRDDGWLILSTHGTWLYHPHPEDHHRWTRQGLLAELAGNGFETTECVAVVGPLGWTTMVRLTCVYQACRRIPWIGWPLAALLAVIMNARGYLEELLTPEWVRRDNGCVYVTLSRARGALHGLTRFFVVVSSVTGFALYRDRGPWRSEDARPHESLRRRAVSVTR